MIDNFIEVLGVDTAAISQAERAIQYETSQFSEELERYSLKDVPEKYVEASKKAQLFILNNFRQQNFETNPSELPIPKFVLPENRDIVESSLDIKNKGNPGLASRLYKYPIVFLDKNLTDIEVAKTICHEMLHFASKSIFVGKNYSTREARSGMHIKGVKPEFDQWFFEEAFAYYFAESFTETLENDAIYSKDFKIKTEVINQLVEKDGPEKGKYIFKEYGLSVDPKYTFLVFSGDNEHYSLGFSGESLTGYIFNLMLEKYSANEKKILLGHLLDSRIDLKEIGKFANMLNNKFGPGTYTRLARCKRNDLDEMKRLINEFTS